MQATVPAANAQFDAGDYTASLQALAALRTPVDAFFDGVMVNAEDPKLKANRLGLLKSLHEAMNRVADLVPPGGLIGRPEPSRIFQESRMKLLILDRDGTLNRSRDDYVASPDEWEALPGALEAVARLNQGGWRVAIATNQSGIGRGLFDMAALNAIHAKMHRQLAAVGGRLEAVFFCPHAPEDGCHCRKPEPGSVRADRSAFWCTPGRCAGGGQCAAPCASRGGGGVSHPFVVDRAVRASARGR